MPHLRGAHERLRNSASDIPRHNSKLHATDLKAILTSPSSHTFLPFCALSFRQNVGLVAVAQAFRQSLGKNTRKPLEEQPVAG